MTSRRGRILLTPEALLDLLDLGADHAIAECFYNDRDDVIEIYVDGPKMPEARLGEIPPTVTPVYRRKNYELLEVRP